MRHDCAKVLTATSFLRSLRLLTRMTCIDFMTSSALLQVSRSQEGNMGTASRAQDEGVMQQKQHWMLPHE